MGWITGWCIIWFHPKTPINSWIEIAQKKSSFIVGRHQFERSIYRLYYTYFCTTIWIKMSIQFWQLVLLVFIPWYKWYNERCRCLWDFSEYLIDCSWMPLIKNQVKSRRKVFLEILEYLDKLDDEISDSDTDNNRDEYINVNEYPRTIMYFSL